jgi:hypothetical protein
VVFFLSMGACSVGEVPAGGGGTTDAGAKTDSGTGGAKDPAATFNSQIVPLVNRCLACHGPARAPDLTSYAALQALYKAKPSSANILVNKGDHEGITYFSATEKTTVAAWIDSL